MIEVREITKSFDRHLALNTISCTIPSGCVYGFVGSNGAGKSTFLRTVCGIYRPDRGEVLLDGRSVYENPAVKNQIRLVPDELYFLPNASPMRMAMLYRAAYPDFDVAYFQKLLDTMHLPAKKSVSTFSKGMKRLTATALALATFPQYVFFDETMDGLDPIMRHLVKSLIAEQVLARGATAVVVSHSLRELEDMCDQLALMHEGGIVLQSDIGNLKTTVFKVQIAFDHPFDKSAFSALAVSGYSQQGSVANLIVNGEREQAESILRAMDPLILEILPLTLEEVFTYEMQAHGYDIKTMLEEWNDEKDAV